MKLLMPCSASAFRATVLAGTMHLLMTAGAVGAQRSEAPSGLSLELLALDGSLPSAALPTKWQIRAVRGKQAPVTSIVDSGAIRFLRISGTDRAAWFVRELETPVDADGGELRWTWRAPLAPAGANLNSPATDDAALRVFVVFARRGLFALRPRAIFYTLADGEARPASTTTNKVASVAAIAVGRPAAARDWVQVTANPARDYRRIWGAEPPRIVAIGLMQDTDQTKTAAIGDVLRLQWRVSNGPNP